MEKRFSGAWGEIYAARYLRDNGYRIFSANYRTRLGEIDIIASDGKSIVFTEVKTRSAGMVAPPAEAVDSEKQSKLIATAMQYISSFHIDLASRFDVVEVYLNDNGELQKINHIKSAFDSMV